MYREFKYRVDDDYDGLTVKTFLKSKGVSAPVFVKLKKTEAGIQINGSWCRVNDIVHLGDIVTIILDEQENSPKIIPVDLPLDIVYEDQDILVVNKASDMPIHPSLNNYDNTLANAVMYYYNAMDKAFVYRCITRLDRDTTGLVLIGKNMLSASILSQAMAAGEIKKEYVALVCGMTEEEGIIEKPIKREKDSAILRCVAADGEYAMTEYRREAYDACRDLSLVSVRPKTGRTHQIRVHMASIGHPLVGDFLYNPDNKDMDRQGLSCCRLSFRHPISGERMDFRLGLPDDFHMCLPELYAPRAST